MLSSELEFLKTISIQAGILIMNIYSTAFSVNTKADNSPVTRADKEANELIVSALHQRYPAYAILSEESQDSDSRLSNPYCFIVDPLDGTKEFVKKTNEFTVNIALTYRGNPIAGVVYAPALQTLYWASKGTGAWKAQVVFSDSSASDYQLTSIQPLHVTKNTGKLTLVHSKSHVTKEENDWIQTHQDKITTTKSAGSSLKGCMVAEGKADVYYRFGPTCEWDTAAMHCIAQEAGATIVQLDGTPLTYNRRNTLNEKGFAIVNHPANLWLPNDKNSTQSKEQLT